MTRRQLVLTTPVMMLAQTPQAPRPALPQNPQEELAAAREVQHRNADQLAKVAVPMSTEPAVHFKA